MKVLIVVSSNVIGGHEVQLSNIINSMPKDSLSLVVSCGDDVVFSFFKKQCCDVDVICDSRFRLLKMNIVFQFIYSLFFLIFNFFYFNKYEKIIFSAGTIEAATPCFLLNLFLDNVCFYVPAINFRKGLFGFFYNPLLCFVVFFFKKIIVINRIQKKIFSKYANSKIYIVRNLIENKYPTLECSFTENFRVVCIGRLDKNKRIFELIQWLDCPDSNVDEIMIFGDGPELTKIQSYFTSHIKIHMFGWMEFGEIYKKLSKNDVFVLNSINEGEPTIIREMQCCGIAVLCRDILGVKGVTDRKVRFNSKEVFLSKLKDIRFTNSKSTRLKEENIEKRRMYNISEFLND